MLGRNMRTTTGGFVRFDNFAQHDPDSFRCSRKCCIPEYIPSGHHRRVFHSRTMPTFAVRTGPQWGLISNLGDPVEMQFVPSVAVLSDYSHRVSGQVFRYLCRSHHTISGSPAQEFAPLTRRFPESRRRLAGHRGPRDNSTVGLKFGER